MRNNLITKDEADYPEAEYVTLDQQVIQRAAIVKASNFNYVNLEHSGPRAREAHANTDNAKLFDLAKTAFDETRLWVHAKPSQRNRDGRQLLKLIWSNQLDVHALDKRNTKNYKNTCAFACHGDKKRHNWQAYVLGHKKFHPIQTALADQEFNDFTDCKKLSFLLVGINYYVIDSVISVVSDGAARAYFEAAQLMLSEQIRMLTESIKFSNRNVLETYAAHGNKPGSGDRGRGGRNGGAGRSDGANMLNGEYDNIGIANINHDFAVHNLNNIDKCWYPDPEYQKLNPLKKLRLYLNQQKQKKSSD